MLLIVIMKLLYGSKDIWIDCTNKFLKNGKYIVPDTDDKRFEIIGTDPCPGVYKDILVIKNEQETVTLSRSEEHVITVEDSIVSISILSKSYPIDNYLGEGTHNKLVELQRKIQHKPGDFSNEFPEQAMILTFLSPDAKVLEIGGNIGRSTAIIGKVIENGDGEAYVLETLKDPYNKNKSMCEKNNFKCTLINAALSEHNLVQSSWNTAIEGSPGTKNWTKIPSITYENLKLQMGFEPTTLILDCEGATTEILKSYPELMNSVDTVIIENDFRDKDDAEYVHNIFRNNGLVKKVSIPLREVVSGNVPNFPCSGYFFEVYKRE